MLGSIINCGPLNAQLNNPGGSGWWRTDVVGANTVNGLAVGNAAFPFNSAFEIHGDLMPTPTGEVFRTDAPNGANTSWRLLRGGTNYGHLFNLSTDVHLRLDASAGDLRLLTNGLERGRFNQTLTGQTINTFGPLDLSGFFGVGNFNGAYPNASARVHVDNTSTLTLGYRDVIKEGFLATRGEALFYGGILDGSNSGVLWSYLTGSSGTPGSFKFIYTGNNTLPNVASTANGLELARFEPATSLNEGYFGIGDWHQPRLLRCSELTRGELINRQHRTA